MDKTSGKIDSTKAYSSGESAAGGASRGHKLELDHHRAMSMTGVKDVPVFTDKNITVVLDGETLYVTGQNLSVKNLDVENGKLSVNGVVHALKYSAQGSTSLVKRIFK